MFVGFPVAVNDRNKKPPLRKARAEVETTLSSETSMNHMPHGMDLGFPVTDPESYNP